jgi:hypothetical protein
MATGGSGHQDRCCHESLDFLVHRLHLRFADRSKHNGDVS